MQGPIYPSRFANTVQKDRATLAGRVYIMIWLLPAFFLPADTGGPIRQSSWIKRIVNATPKNDVPYQDALVSGSKKKK